MALLGRLLSMVVAGAIGCDLFADETLTLPQAQRPEWLRRDGIVMAGSWEPLLFRVRRDGAPNYVPTPEQRAAYQREHSRAMLQELKSLGVNFIMAHCFKGAGMVAERESMNDAVQFSRLCHEMGFRVGTYCTSSTMLWDLFFQEQPEAQDWSTRDAEGRPVTYGRATYRYYWNRNHPGVEAYLQQVVRFAIEKIGVDLVHLDNYHTGPGWEDVSQERFANYLKKTFSPPELAALGVAAAKVPPPRASDPELLQYAWRDFSCSSLTDAYHRMSRFARTIRSDVLMECNPAGIRPRIEPPVDHGRLLRGGEAFWDEGRRPGFQKNTLSTRIRTYKVARRMENSAFTYVTTPLEMAESMAFNLDCLGAVCWFEYAKINRSPGVNEPMDRALLPYIRFFNTRRELLRDASVVADVAVLRSFPSMVFSTAQEALVTWQVEQALIENRIPFQIVFDDQLDDLGRYRTVILAGCTAMSDAQAAGIRRYVAGGGRLCVIGPLAIYDHWKRPRPKPALEDLPAAAVSRGPLKGDWMSAVKVACQGSFSLAVEGPPGLCAELTEQSHRRLVHLVNYRADEPARDVGVRVKVAGKSSAPRVTLASPGRGKDLSVSCRREGGFVVFRVPAVAVYEVAIVE